MKAYFKFIFATLAATAALAGCTKEISSEEAIVVPASQAAEGTRVIAVSFAPQTKTALDKDGLQPKFAAGDSILISNEEALDTCEVTVSGGKATISTDLTGPLKAVYPYTAAAIDSNDITGILVSTEQDGTFASANICKAEMENENEVSLTFGNKTAVFRLATGAGAETKYVEVSAKGFAIANQFPEGSKYTSLDTIHIEVPEANKPSQYFVSILVPDGLKVGDLSFSDGTNVKLISDENLATPVAVNSIYTVTALNWEVIGALKGVFSVSADRKVHFSQGNLYCSRPSSESSDWTWHFYGKQYQVNSIPTTSDPTYGYYGRTAAETDTEIDLFTWGYSAATSLDPVGESHLPGRAVEFETLSSSEGGDDWGVAYCESNGITAGIWRTLTTEEWQYLFSYDGRENGGPNYDNNLRHGKFKCSVTVCGKENCIVLLPDDWKWDANTVGTDWQTEYPEIQTSNEVTWRAMEKAGAVCLPAAGFRGGSNVQGVGYACGYWSSSSGVDHEAYEVVSYPEEFVADVCDSLYSGISVRLVTDVKVDPVAAYTSAYLDTISSVPAWEFDLTTWDGDDSKCADIYVKAEMAGKVCGNYTIESSGAFAGEAFTSTFGGKPVASGTISITLLEPKTINTKAYYEVKIAGVTQDGNAFSCKYGSTITAYDAKGYSVSVIDDGYVPEPVCFEIPDVADISNAVYVQNQIGVTIRVNGGNTAMTTASCDKKTVTIDGRQYSFSRKLNTTGKSSLASDYWKKISIYAPAKGTMYVITDNDLEVISGTSGGNKITTAAGDGYVSFFADFVNGENNVYTLTFASAIEIYGFVFVPDNTN